MSAPRQRAAAIRGQRETTMRTNPFSDAWLFLIGATDDHRALGVFQYVMVALFCIAHRERVDRVQELVGKFGAAECRQCDHLGLPSADRRTVAPGLPLEVAVAGFRRLRVLDRSDGRACGLRVSPRAGQERISAVTQHYRSARVSG